MQAYDSIMCGCFCIEFIDFMLKGKSLLEYTNLFSPNDYEKNDKIILKNPEKPKISYLLDKTFVVSFISSTCRNQDEKIFKEEEPIEILKNVGLIENI